MTLARVPGVTSKEAAEAETNTKERKKKRRKYLEGPRYQGFGCGLGRGSPPDALRTSQVCSSKGTILESDTDANRTHFWLQGRRAVAEVQARCRTSRRCGQPGSSPEPEVMAGAACGGQGSKVRTKPGEGTPFAVMLLPQEADTTRVSGHAPLATLTNCYHGCQEK